MGLIIDTGVLIRLEKNPTAVDFSAYKPAYGEGFISAATCSELLVGVHLANTEQRKARRSAFVEAVFKLFHPLPFDLEVARVHAHLVSSLGRGVTLGATGRADRSGHPMRRPGCGRRGADERQPLPFKILNLVF